MKITEMKLEGGLRPPPNGSPDFSYWKWHGKQSLTVAFYLTKQNRKLHNSDVSFRYSNIICNVTHDF